MKDLPHHIRKLNRRIIRSLHKLEREEDLDLPDLPRWPMSEKQKKKQAKERVKQERQARSPEVETTEEANRKMKKRVPVFGPASFKKPPTKAPRKKGT